MQLFLVISQGTTPSDARPILATADRALILAVARLITERLETPNTEGPHHTSGGASPVLLDRRSMAEAAQTSPSTIERLEAEGLPVLDLTPRATQTEGRRRKRILRYDPAEVLAWLRARRATATEKSVQR